MLSHNSMAPELCEHMLGCTAQTTVQMLLLIVALLCVPVMLLAKPLLLRNQVVGLCLFARTVSACAELCASDIIVCTLSISRGRCRPSICITVSCCCIIVVCFSPARCKLGTFLTTNCVRCVLVSAFTSSLQVNLCLAS